MNKEELNLKRALMLAESKSIDGNLYVVWREDYRHNHDEFIVSDFNAYIEEACLMAIEYGRFQCGEEV